MLSKIRMAQIDPNGLCNSECWFCPVAYKGNPESARKNMPVEELDRILRQLHDGKGDFVSNDFNFVYTAHYNEVLLYKHFEEMLQLFRKYGFQTIVLTNGTPLTKAKTDIIKQYKDVVYGICFNIPSANAERWSKLVNMNVKMFDKMIENIKYAIQELPEMYASRAMSIQVNGVNKHSLTEYGGWLDMLPNAPVIDFDPVDGSLATEFNEFLAIFPQMNVHMQPSLIDRAGHLDKANVMTNIKGIDLHAKRDNTKVIGCNNGREWGGRPEGWVHVNSNGDVFICCNDYDFETVFGNTYTTPLKEIWEGKERQDMIAKSYNSFCTTCSAAIWGN